MTAITYMVIKLQRIYKVVVVVVMMSLSSTAYMGRGSKDVLER